MQDPKPRREKLPAAKDKGETLLGWGGRLQGLAADQLGNVYVAGAESHTSGEAVAVISPDGKVVAMVLGVPRNVSGLAFGGKGGRKFYVTGGANTACTGSGCRPPARGGEPLSGASSAGVR